MSFEINNSWLNLTNQSIINDNDERFNFKSTSEGCYFKNKRFYIILISFFFS
jgi:hypothetical protein